MIVIPSDIRDMLIEHAREAAPVEACGYLAGDGSRIRKVYRLTNADNSPEHFSMNPKEQFAVVKDARQNGLELISVYHSHPVTPARMSDEDLRLAFAPEMLYTIVSLQDQNRPDVRCFRVVGGRAIEEPVVIEG